jgi:hypothetical protein
VKTQSGVSLLSFVSLLAAISGAAACTTSVGQDDPTETAQSAATSCAAVYYQCGGLNWTGATCCASGSTCQYQNEYYSQCVPGSGGGSGSGGGGGGQCPPAASNDPQLRAAASAAFDLMRLGAQGQVSQSNAYWVYSVLASQRYRVASGGASIEFDPTDPLYSYVTSTMKARLAIAQLDSSVGAFLVSGLQYAYANTNGKQYPSIPAIQGLDGYTYPGPTSNVLLDHGSGDSVVITGSPWCQTETVAFAQTCRNTHSYAPMVKRNIIDWRSTVPSLFTGTADTPSTPFNGNSAAGNPYLIVSVNGQTTTWATYNFVGEDCYTLPNATCTGTLVVDPIPYTQPADYYDANGNLVGPQANPFSLIVTSLYADSSHQGQWATRTVNGVQQWGTFSSTTTVAGMTVYGYVKMM